MDNLVFSDEPKTVLEVARGIDIFGDIHGQAEALHAGLETLGYEQRSGVWRHPEARKALFLGDLIDRGPKSRQVVNTVRMMVEHAEAVCIMGNHELNAVHFAQPHPETEGFLRPRTDKNLFQHVAFLHEYRGKEERDALTIDLAFFRTLPMMVELDGMRAVHACWNEQYLSEFTEAEISGAKRGEDFWLQTSKRGHRQHSAIEVLLKGPEKELPNGRAFYDKDGHKRRHARVLW
ncbi:metallophosphoesterase [Erythrobacter sp. SD-21]|uniref:metallophosphoesterase n=1 Tax=Erythrobacter sp. SD-21 TaxID=161528 RepID=UPI000153F0C5|nr:metallophosphoesterase [Erythrobacter sp. SD-21]EDL48251.1 Diadenosine tetraphosphatase and related serine/threonine protein phosphatase [Erythrobacter sp. SD-21]